MRLTCDQHAVDMRPACGCDMRSACGCDMFGSDIVHRGPRDREGRGLKGGLGEERKGERKEGRGVRSSR
eukprot:857046-Rhodomonas_salina.1